ncbi:MAG: hypothetical protein SFV24_08825 [Gemmatimonadales bacterium]|nr:hypothetical protein [Gemmatimonadales bacterium]
MSYAVYKLIHFLGIFTIVAILAATAMHVLRGGTRADNPYRRTFAVAHGIAAFLVLLGGFGMLARMKIVSGGLPGWVIAKLVIWLVLSAALTLPYRGRTLARALLVALPILAMGAGAVALYKPFTATPAVTAQPASP